MTSIPLFQLRLKLGPDDEVDTLPRRFDEPNVFVPGRLEDISLVLSSLGLASARRTAKESATLMRTKGSKRLHSEVTEAENKKRDEQGQTSKTEQSHDSQGQESAFDLTCEVVPSYLNAHDLLGLGTRSEYEGQESIFYQALTLVTHLPLPQITGSRAGKKKRENDQRESTQAVLGHIVPSRFRADHPIKQLDDSALLHSEWLRFDKCVVSLCHPILPDVTPLGLNHPSAAGRAVLAYDEVRGSIWEDPQTKVTWTDCPHRLVTAEQLFGSMTLTCSITEKALKYGTSPEDDGFVDTISVSRRDLTLSSKLRKILTPSFCHEDGLVRLSQDPDQYWSRKRERFYDVVEGTSGGAKSLPLDNRLETALESTRPKTDSNMLEPPESIKTALMPFQKKALAWMQQMEEDTAQDEGALLPQWDRIECTSLESVSVEPRTKRLKLDHSGSAALPSCLYMDKTTGVISLKRMTSRRSEAGGCLCDAMGLGKSLTTLSLIETHQKSSSYINQSRSAVLAAGLEPHLRPFASTATLLVVPSSLVHQWYSEVNKHLSKDVGEAEGDEYIQRYKRGTTLPWSADSDRQEIRRQTEMLFAGSQQPCIVLATYEDLRLELLQSKKSKNAVSPLLEIHWWRIMLDEAQLVSTSNGSAAEMVNCLWRVNGWIITSTPFNSSIRDMHGLLTFLDSDFASKKLFDELIANPFLEGKEEGILRAHALLKRIMWRHRKEHVESELGLPPSTMDTLLLEARGLEKTLYEREFKSMLESVKTAVALGRTLTKGQANRLIALRRMISHPQLATQLGYKASGGQRTTFANLFADLIYRKQGEIQAAQWELIVCALKVGAGRRFQREEKDRSMWRGGSCSITHFDNKMRKARELTLEGCEREDVQQREVAIRREAANQASTADQLEQGVEKEDDADVGIEGKKEAEAARSENQEEKTGQPPIVESGGQVEEGETAVVEGAGLDVRSAAAASASMRYTEATYWLEVLLASRGRQEEVELPGGARIDPERLINLFFERKVVEASSVDVDDARYHPVLLDAGDEEEEMEDDEEGKKAALGTAVLLKNRFRGNQKRSVRRVWYYHPRRKLQALCRDFIAIEEKIDRLQREGSFLHTRLQEELGPERARLALKEGFDTLQQSDEREGEVAVGQTCIICMDAIEIPGVLPCLHTACFMCLKDCIDKMADSTGRANCSLCRKPYSRQDIIEVLPAMTEMEQVDEFGVKISGLITHIRSQMQVNPNVKIVIFSAWSHYLTMLTKALNELEEEPIKSIAFSGKEQSKALSKFQKDDSIRIILVPMRMAEGAAGLTLNIASVAYLLEPSLDSALEDQALGRLNRIGQKAAKTTYYRVLVKNTIEPALVEIAEKRQEKQEEQQQEEGKHDQSKSISNAQRHHDHLTAEELAHVFGLDLKTEKEKKKREKNRAKDGNAGQSSSLSGQEEPQ